MKKMKIISVIMLTTMLLCACGNSSKTQNESTTIETEAKDASTLFTSIELGMNRGEVAEAFGSDGLDIAEFEVGEKQFRVLLWISADFNNYMQVTFEDGKVIGKNQIEIATECKDVTLETFNKMEKGMSYDEIKTAAGSDGKVMAETEDFKVYSWMTKDGASINVVIKDDKVESLSQHGLS